MIDFYQRPTIKELVGLVLTGGYETGDHIDQVHIPEIAKKLNIKTKKNGNIYYEQLGKKKIIKIALLCFKELLEIAKTKRLIKNNYECMLIFELKSLFLYYEPSYQKIEDESDCSTIITTEENILFPNNFESFINEFDKFHPPELFLIEHNLDNTKKGCDLSFLSIEKYLNNYSYSVECIVEKEEINYGVYYNRYIRIAV